jgi:phage regulator Rha-like protein
MKGKAVAEPKSGGKMKELILVEFIESKIYLIRGHRVMLNSDLAELYGVETRTLVQAVKRNVNRFPSDFMFQLNFQDIAALRSQTVTLKKGRGGHRKYAPYVFTENGVAMLSSVLNSERAIEVNIAIMRVFVKLREMIASNKDLAKRLDDLEKKYDAQFRVVFDAICELMRPPEKPKRKIGFKRESE